MYNLVIYNTSYFRVISLPKKIINCEQSNTLNVKEKTRDDQERTFTLKVYILNV